MHGEDGKRLQEIPETGDQVVKENREFYSSKFISWA
jgi:hypothetical protein